MNKDISTRQVLLVIMAMCIVFAVAGCAHRNLEQSGSISYEDNKARLLTFQYWTMEGKFSLRSPNASPSGRIAWTQIGERFELVASGTLGFGATRISGTLDQIEVQSQQGTWIEDDPSLYVQQLAGSPVNLRDLSWWLQGMHNPNEQVHRLRMDASGFPTSFEQSGWNIEISAHAAWESARLPERLVISKDDHTLTLLIQQFELKTVPEEQASRE